jgi:hypothetical protein
MLTRSGNIEHNTTTRQLLGHGCEGTLAFSATQSKSLLRAVLINDQIPASITQTVLLFVGINNARPTGTTSSTRSGNYLMKKGYTARICCTCVTQGVSTAKASVDARLCVLLLSGDMHDPKIASTLWISCFVTSESDIPQSNIPIVACDDAYARQAIVENPENTPSTKRTIDEIRT